MKKQPLSRHLLEANLALSRENACLADHIAWVERALSDVERIGKASGIVRLDRLSEIGRELRRMIQAVEAHRTKVMGHEGAPTAPDLGKVAQYDEKITSYTIDINPEMYGEILDKMLKDLFQPKKPEPPKDPDSDGIDEYKNAVNFLKKKPNWWVNFGGDLEGEWQDYQDKENPENPLDET